ncbi:hypothetical protein NC651_009932 [Populus alba x Populus x berolinensis]|nr:hypothetical protein NC651_009932 [Populus alba x Populus x berolinensis]
MGGLGKEGAKRVLMLEAIQDLYLFNHRSITLKSPLSSPWKKTFSRKVIFNLLREGEFVEEEAPWDGVFFGFSSYFQHSKLCWIWMLVKVPKGTLIWMVVSSFTSTTQCISCGDHIHFSTIAGKLKRGST